MSMGGAYADLDINVDVDWEPRGVPRASDWCHLLEVVMRRVAIAVFVALVVVACGGGTSETTVAPSTPSTTAAPPNTTGSTTTTAAAATVPAGTAFGDAITVGEPIQLASTHRVVNVPDDDVLNVRLLPGAGGPLAAELDPAYSTFRFTGETRAVGDGGNWAKVVLSDPAVQLVFDPEDYQLPWGWLNAFYMDPLEEWAPVNGSCNPSGGLTDHAGDPSSTYGQLIDLLLIDFGTCTQLVVTLAEENGQQPLGTTLPDVTATVLPSGIVRLEVLPPTSGWLQVLWPATEIISTDLEVYTVRGLNGEVWIDIHGASQASVEYLGGQGQIVVHIADGAPVGTEKDDSVVGAFYEATAATVHLWGYARPFEANLSVRVLDATDTVVAVPATSDVAVYGAGSGAFGIGTTDWFETWGWWDLQLDVTGLAAGDYTVAIADDGALEDGPFVEAPFTIP
ncbi:MAG: hypothetical protein HKN46_07570 [Acidimicrobiia bacterium]|nr:hypothetical protein [Acidimicrobiia bacterium]